MKNKNELLKSMSVLRKDLYNFITELENFEHNNNIDINDLIVEKYPFDMDMKRGRYIVDAKSLLGLMNLGFDQKIELKVYDEECDDLWKELDKFVAA